MPWDPATYEKFRDERYAPFADLCALIEPRAGMRVVDLGCGTGELTARLAELLPDSDVVGIDSSAEMLARADEYVRPGLRFEQRSIEDVAGSYDLVFSHAALQWVSDHDTLVPWLFKLVAKGGQIAVQIPSNHHHLTHLLIVETATGEPYAGALGGWTRTAPVLAIDQYASMLHRSGAADITVFEKVYAHVLADADAMVDWTRGTALVPYIERLPEDLRERFLDRYREKVRAAFPERPVLYPFRRTLFAARRPGG
jgi:trans-aconitate 2-methyltransferase